MSKKKQDEKELIHKSIEPHSLPCKLTTEQKAESADQLATAIQQAESLELERKSVMGNFKSRKEFLIERIHNLTTHVKDGIEMRSVDCTLSLNYSKLKATLTRNDTNQIIEERPMTEEEKQMEFEYS